MGASYTIGTSTLRLTKNTIAPGETIKGTLTLNIERSTNLSQISVFLTSYELSKNLLYQQKSSKYYNRYITNTLSHPIFHQKITSTSRGPLYYNFSFKLPDKLQPTVSSSGVDFELSHTYSIETTLETAWTSYIASHNIDVKSISFDNYEDEYFPTESYLISTADTERVNCNPCASLEKSGILSVSAVGVENKYVDIEAIYDFAKEPPGKYLVKFGFDREYLFKNRIGMKSRYPMSYDKTQYEITSNGEKLRFSASIPVGVDTQPCYSGKFGSLSSKAYFKIEKVGGNKYSIFEDSKEIPIKTSYNTSKPYSDEAKLVNRTLHYLNFQHKDLIMRLLLRYGIFIVAILYSLYTVPKDQKIKLLEEEEEDEENK